jgi:hypothetical protein
MEYPFVPAQASVWIVMTLRAIGRTTGPTGVLLLATAMQILRKETCSSRCTDVLRYS